MSTCFGRYASRSLKVLKPLFLLSVAASVPSPEPLFYFCYWRLPRLAFTRPYHTEREPEQDSKPNRQVPEAIAAPEEIKAQDAAYQPCHDELHASTSRDTTKSHSLLWTETLPFVTGSYSPSAAESGGIVRRVLQPKVNQPPEDDLQPPKLKRIVNGDLTFEHLCRLTSASPPPSTNTTVLSLPTVTLRKLVGHLEPNAWVHHASSGCAVKMTTCSDDSSMTVELAGSERARQITEQFLREGADYTEPQENSTWSDRAVVFPPYNDVRNFPRPPLWTLQSFQQYVSALVRLRPRRSAMRFIHTDVDAHSRLVGRIIFDAFSDPGSAPFASTYALRLAVKFCKHHKHLNKIVKQLWAQSMNLGLQPDLCCYNEMLETSMKVKAMKTFKAVLVQMEARGIQPDARTWSLVLRGSCRPGNHEQVLEIIKNKTRLSTSAEKSLVACAIIDTEFQAYLNLPDGLLAFRQYLDAYLGSDWITPRLVARMLRISRFQQAHASVASDLLGWINEQGRLQSLVDRTCLVELIRLAVEAGNLNDALTILKLQIVQNEPDLGQHVIESLFCLGWRLRRPNLCRLLWFQAATSGRITFVMQNAVRYSLVTNAHSDKNPEVKDWLCRAGKIIVGTNLDSDNFEKIFPSLFEDSNIVSLFRPLSEWQSTKSTSRHEQHQLAQVLVERDVNAWRFFRRIPGSMFLELLDQAVALDEQWQAEGVMHTSALEDLINESLQINLVKRRQPLRAADLSPHLAVEPKWFIANGYRLNYDSLQVSAGPVEEGMDPEWSDSTQFVPEVDEYALETDDARLGARTKINSRRFDVLEMQEPEPEAEPEEVFQAFA
ncbi:hypothetical protein LTS08_004446 [Lithohypha guttulata]|uniref:uncharacterized protein n=1 Tax=Lithohypha guttulata TaxID=1690604 RepID=UPI002DE009C6|nr:hypothetical protein LTR51_007590 [Lithohypha guttulata]KAK5101986.1 hypothetical protein LTS08_004446 [Lithohypha guttulata]